jgi:hypothetical protein
LIRRDNLIDGFYFYEKQEPGLGNYFLTSLYSDMEAVKILFGIHPRAYRGFHRALSNRFPFAIYTNVPLLADFWFGQGAWASRPCSLKENGRDARSP